MLFDIDGTLVDSNYLHVAAWMAALLEAGQPVDAVDIHRAIGMGSSQLLIALVGEKAASEIGEDLKEAHKARYQASFEMLRRFEGSRELLETVASRARVVLATSAGADEVKALRAALDADGAISAVTGAADVESAKPAPDLVEVALEKAGTGPDRAVFVGDTVWDIEACAKVGVPCVAVLTGGISAAELRDAGAIAVYRSVSDILEDLDNSPLNAVLSPRTR